MREVDFNRLFDEHADGLFAFLVYRTGNRPLAEDLVAETFERALTARRRFDPRKGSEKTWVYAIALNLLRDHGRRKTVEQRALERVSTEGRAVSGDSALTALEQSDELHRALARLGEQEREAVALRFGADLTLRQIARALGEREDAIRKRISRALVKLREELG
jgi:RNA polymerase sigma-70 factor (ECF subfamily)